MEINKLYPFCTLQFESSHNPLLLENDIGFVIRDGYPITNGHALIIPKRHVSSFFEISQQERQDLFDLVDKAKVQLDKEFQPASYNIGINDCEAAGQTIPHLHIHLIPRYKEPDKDPCGSVCWLVSEKADSWGKMGLSCG